MTPARNTPAAAEQAGPREYAQTLGVAATAVAVAGLAIATYLSVMHYAGGAPACAIAHGCATVQASSYAELRGVPVALLGVLGTWRFSRRWPATARPEGR